MNKIVFLLQQRRLYIEHNGTVHLSVVVITYNGMRCVATEILLVVGVAVETVTWMHDGLVSAASARVGGFIVASARQRNRKEIPK